MRTLGLLGAPCFALLAACGSSSNHAQPGDGGTTDARPGDAGADSHVAPTDSGVPLLDAPGGDAASDGALPPVTTHPTNILNNGGFESGLMCYGQYEWGSNPANMGTGYAFSLSTDAQEGKYSLQIACVNPGDCGFPAKAAIESYPIESPPSQAYKVSVFTKCNAGDNAFFYTPSSAAGDFTSSFACTGQWAQNSFTFTSAASPDASSASTTVSYALYYAGTGTFLIDGMVMTLGDGSVPAQTVQHPGSRVTSVSGSTTLVDGKPYVPLGFYQIPPDQLTAARQMGANTVAWGDPGCYNTSSEVYADLAYEAGINLIPESSTTARLGAPQVLPAVLAQFGSHLADIAWYLDDEPDLSAVAWQPISPATLTAEYMAIHGASALPVGVMLQEAHYADPSIDQPYAPAMDVYLSEPYGSSYDGITHSMTVFATMTKRPVWLAEDDSLDPALIVPKAYFGFTSGATGLLFFTYGGFVADAKISAAAQALTELSSLTAAITGTDVTSMVTGPPGISFIARSAGGSTTILAVNPAAMNVTGSFTVGSVSGASSTSVSFESRTIPIAGGAFSDTFTGVSRHVYVLP